MHIPDSTCSPFHFHLDSYTPFHLHLGSYPIPPLFGFIYPVPPSFRFIYPIPHPFGFLFTIPPSFGFIYPIQPLFHLYIAKLAAYGVSPVSLPLLHSYLRDRSQRVRIEDVTSDVLVFSKGVPQGSVLGPLLFSIFFLMICSTLLIVLICPIMLMITKFNLVIAILRW